MIFYRFAGRSPWNYGVLPGLLLALLLTSLPAQAQHASQPAFDPRQTEKRFDNWRSGETPARPQLPMPNLARPKVGADTRPLFELHHVTIIGAHAIPLDRLAVAYQPYIGKKVSQADLAAIAAAISETYRAAGFHLSRAIVPPQDIKGGRVRVEMIEGGIAEVVLKGEGTEELASGRCSIPCWPSSPRGSPRWSGNCC